MILRTFQVVYIRGVAMKLYNRSSALPGDGGFNFFDMLKERGDKLF